MLCVIVAVIDCVAVLRSVDDSGDAVATENGDDEEDGSDDDEEDEEDASVAGDADMSDDSDLGMADGVDAADVAMTVIDTDAPPTKRKRTKLE